MQSSIRFDIYGAAYDRRMSTTKTLGQTIGALRAARKITQGKLATAIGIKTQGAISSWENSRARPSPVHDHRKARP